MKEKRLRVSKTPVTFCLLCIGYADNGSKSCGGG